MSSTFRLLRERWSARSMIITRWLRKPGDTFRRGDELCELELDGQADAVRYEDDELLCGVYWHYVDEGEEVGPFGDLFEYTTSASAGFRGVLIPRHIRARKVAYRPRTEYPKVFLSYRRADSEAYAGRLREEIARRFGASQVFMDQFSIEAGEDYEWTIQQAVAHCSVFVAVIGPDWKGSPDANGRCPLESEEDLLRREITAALDRGVPVMPVLVAGAAVPRSRDLPYEMHGLEKRQATVLDQRHWESEVTSLLDKIGVGVGDATHSS
jgi:hypothetical protein